MNRDDIIRMAREAGFVIDEKAKQHQPNCIFHTHHMVDELLERFFNLAYEAGAAAEREACAQVSEDWDSDMADPRDIAAAIRARGKK